MTLSIVAAFWAVSFLFVITPGADWAYAISAGMRGRWVTPAVAGLLSGHLLATVVVAAGVGGLVASNPMVLSVMTLAGAGYLLWLGVSMIRQPSVPASGAGLVTDSGLRWAWKGLCVSGLNPKVFCCFWHCCLSSPTRYPYGRSLCKLWPWVRCTRSVVVWCT